MNKTVKIVLMVLLAAGLLVLPFTVKNYRVFQFNLVLVYAIAVLGLNLLTGFNGQISLGHGAFYALGAYTAAVLMDTLSAPAFNKRRTSSTALTPPPTVRGIKTQDATCSTTCKIMSR